MGRISFSALGTAVGLSANAAADRVRRLERDGVITGFTALLDPAKVGRSFEALIDVRIAVSAKPEDFERGVALLPAIVQTLFVTGRFDYQLRVACRDADELDQAVRAIRRLGATVTETRIVMRSTEHNRGP